MRSARSTFTFLHVNQYRVAKDPFSQYKPFHHIVQFALRSNPDPFVRSPSAWVGNSQGNVNFTFANLDPFLSNKVSACESYIRTRVSEGFARPLSSEISRVCSRARQSELMDCRTKISLRIPAGLSVRGHLVTRTQIFDNWVSLIEGQYWVPPRCHQLDSGPTGSNGKIVIQMPGQPGTVLIDVSHESSRNAFNASFDLGRALVRLARESSAAQAIVDSWMRAGVRF